MPTISTEDAKLSVKRGAELLDKHFPDWEHEIDFKYLNLSGLSTCICGQLNIWEFIANHWFKIVEPGTEFSDYGLDIPMESRKSSSYVIRENYILLEGTWKELITERLE